MTPRAGDPGAAQVLPGGTANHGRVIRVGDTVRRPTGQYTAAVHALLDHLALARFTGAPRVVGTDGDVEILRYIEGEAATEPIPEHALSDETLVRIGTLLRSYHDSVAGFDGAGLTWQRRVPARWRGDLITHNDVNPANVVFRGGHPTALLDFDLAAPGCAAWDLSVTACFWVPLRDAADIPDARRGRVADRFRLLLDGYGADPAVRRDAALAAVEANRWIADVIEDAARDGHPAFGRLWEQAMGMHERASAWLGAHTTELLAASR